ncbi:MAG: L-fucose isomerase [Planctomycetes bacterium]|nr:L-fucose isomerase [Planctomycetota bacterium]
MTNSDEKIRVGLLSFSDGRARVHENLRTRIEKYDARVCAVLDALGAETVAGGQIVHSPRTAVSEAKQLVARDVEAVVFNIPVFAFPNFPAIAARILCRPLAILAPGEGDLPGLGGLMAAGGAMAQIGIVHERIWGPYESDQTRRRLGVFLRAAAARHRLIGQTYGQIGGRSIGMMTGVSSSPAQWLKIFGVDIDHADESEILRLAAEVPDSQRRQIVDWLEKNLRSVQYREGSKLTRKSLEFQAACAAAVKRIIEERQFDFIGIKCHYDMSEYYCTQCLSAAFLPSRCDWDGPRRPVACACEADGDGAMTMQILHLLSGQSPLFLDLRHYDSAAGLWTLCNCGGQSVDYAARPDDSRQNLKAVDLVPVIEKYGGVGAHVRYLAAPGPLTFARLMHDSSGPSLLAFKGEAVAARPEQTEKTCPAWPHVFARLDAGPEKLIPVLHANHVHAVAGDCLAELEMFARLLGIPFVAV